MRSKTGIGCKIRSYENFLRLAIELKIYNKYLKFKFKFFVPFWLYKRYIYATLNNK